MNCGGRNMRLRLKVFVQPPYSTREHIVKYDNQKGLDSLSQGWRIAWPYGPRGYIIKAEARSYRMVLSFEALTIVLPSGLMATLLTRFECPSSVVLNRPVPVSHTLWCMNGTIMSCYMACMAQDKVWAQCGRYKKVYNFEQSEYFSLGGARVARLTTSLNIIVNSCGHNKGTLGVLPSSSTSSSMRITWLGKWLTHRIILSSDPETRVLPSRLMATLLTSPSCPSSRIFSTPVSMSHTLLHTTWSWCTDNQDKAGQWLHLNIQQSS